MTSRGVRRVDKQMQNEQQRKDETRTAEIRSRTATGARGRLHEIRAVRRRQSTTGQYSVTCPLNQWLDVVHVVDLGAFVTTSLTHVHLDVIETLHCRTDYPNTRTDRQSGLQVST